MKFSIIAAIAQNGVIGLNGSMPWRLKSDLQRFKRITINSPIIMGRKTWESLPAPLKNRSHIILTRDISYETKFDNVVVVNSLQEAQNIAIKEAIKLNKQEIFIIGGAQIYYKFLKEKLVDKLYITWILDAPHGDTIFALDIDNWNKIYKEIVERDEKDSSETIFEIYEKIK